MKIKGLPFIDNKITTYLFSLADLNILFDFGTNNLSIYEIKSLDYIFISHYHYDHIFGLINNLENLSNKTKLCMTNTTFLTIKNIILSNYKDNSANLINILSSHYFELTYFKTYYKNYLEFEIFRSGHTFGGYMLYIKDKNTSLFFSSDMDYVKDDFARQYYIDKKINVDFAILDGTRIDNETFKENKITSIKFNNKNDMYLYCKLEKAICIAEYLSNKYPNNIIIYDYDLETYIKDFYYNGYDCFFNENVFTHSGYKGYENNKKTKIILSSIKRNNCNFFPDNLFSLHITDNDRKEFIAKYLSENCKIILGHYTDKNIDEYCKQNNYLFIKEGDNYYEK